MSIVEKIKQSVEAIGIDFAYGSESDINEIISRHDFNECKLCYCQLLETGTAVQSATGRWHDSVNVALFVVDTTDFDFDTLENESIIEECMKLVFRWLYEQKRSDTIKVSTPTNSTRIYDEFDDIVTGYGIQVTIEDKVGYGSCDYDD